MSVILHAIDNHTRERERRGHIDWMAHLMIHSAHSFIFFFQKIRSRMTDGETTRRHWRATLRWRRDRWMTCRDSAVVTVDVASVTAVPTIPPGHPTPWDNFRVTAIWDGISNVNVISARSRPPSWPFWLSWHRWPWSSYRGCKSFRWDRNSSDVRPNVKVYSSRSPSNWFYSFWAVGPFSGVQRGRQCRAFSSWERWFYF